MSILVVADGPFSIEVVGDQLRGREHDPQDEVFFLLVRFRRWARYGFRRARSWTAVHAWLDSTLDELAEMGILADGLVTDAPSVDAAQEILRTFEPRELIAVCPRWRRRYRTRLERTLLAYARESDSHLKITSL